MDNNQQKSANASFSSNQPISYVPNKEKEVIQKTSETYLTEIGQEQDIPQEIKKVGVIQRQENIEIPPDLQNIGLKPTGSAVSLPAKPTLKLPISDEKIEKGLHESIFHSLRWLAEWCLLQLKRMHLTLKVIKGVVKRVRI